MDVTHTLSLCDIHTLNRSWHYSEVTHTHTQKTCKTYKLMHKNCKYCRQKKVCAVCNKVSLAGQACDRSPAVLASTPTQTPSLWPLGLRNKPGVNREWRGNSQKLPEPSHPSPSASLSLCPPCNSWSGSESSAGPHREGQCRHIHL